MIDSCYLLWQGVTIQILSGRLQFFLRRIQPAFWPAAPLHRTSVLPQAKPWRRANSLRPSILISRGIQKNNHTFWCGYFFGASDEARTRYLHLGKVALYQMSYTRNNRVYISRFFPCCQLLFSISSTFFFPEHSRSSSARNSGSSNRGRYQ